LSFENITFEDYVVGCLLSFVCVCGETLPTAVLTFQNNIIDTNYVLLSSASSFFLRYSTVTNVTPPPPTYVMHSIRGSN